MRRMNPIERADRVVATHTGQTVGWILVIGLVTGFFGQVGTDGDLVITVIALGLTWMLGASYGRRQIAAGAEHDEDAEN